MIDYEDMHKTEEEKQWQAESDARILVRVEAIKKDKDRLERARTVAAKMAKQAAEEAKNLKKISRKTSKTEKSLKFKNM